MNTASQSSGHDIIIGFQPIPPALEKVMRTVDRQPEADSLDVGAYTKRAARVIAEIRAALDDHEGFEDGQSALGIAEERNTVSGARGLILHRFLRSGRYSGPLGEILSESGRLDPAGIELFDQFGLKLFIHQAENGGRPDYRAFAVTSENQSSTTFWFLARLLVTPFEAEQWKPIPDENTGAGV